MDDRHAYMGHAFFRAWRDVLRTEQDICVGAVGEIGLVGRLIGLGTAMLSQQNGQGRLQVLQTHNIARDAFHVEEASHQHQLRMI
jgi:hypothetical protein